MRLPGSDKVIVGYDLGKDYAQISCYVTGREEEITTLSSVDRKSTRLNSSHRSQSRMPSSA